MSSAKSGKVEVSEVRVDLPRYRKCMFCVSLRGGLLAWGALQALAVVLIAAVNVVWFTNKVLHDAEPGGREPTLDPAHWALQVLAVAASALDVLVTCTLVLAVLTTNCRFLNVCYAYFSLKMWSCAALLALGQLLMVFSVYGFRWNFDHLDPVRYYLFIYNPAVGIIDIVLQGYLALLVRSQILALGGRPRLAAFRLRIRLECGRGEEEQGEKREGDKGERKGEKTREVDKQPLHSEE